MPAPRSLAPARLAVLGLLALLAACCVTPPDAEEVLNTGFRSPRQTLATFQVGVRGDLARLEYRCFSVDYRARHGLSQLGYREFRERELAANPWFQVGVADARVVSSETLGPLRHRIVAASHGYRFEVGLVREDAWQLWSGERLLADELLRAGGFPANVEVSAAPGRSAAILAVAELPPSLDLHDPRELRREVTEFRVAQEWKIDSIRRLDEADETDPPEFQPEPDPPKP